MFRQYVVLDSDLRVRYTNASVTTGLCSGVNQSDALPVQIESIVRGVVKRWKERGVANDEWFCMPSGVALRVFPMDENGRTRVGLSLEPRCTAV